MTVTYRSASRISEADSAIDAEYKAAMANTAVCQVHIEHFTRLIALIDHADTRGGLEDLADLYLIAFATVPNIDLTTLTHDNARTLAGTVIDEMGLAVHELDWGHSNTPPISRDEEMLRKSQAVVDEDHTLKRLTEIHRQLCRFEDALGTHWWARTFTWPGPFARTDTTQGDPREHR